MRLLVCCHTRPELDRVARLLDAAVVADGEADTFGVRYEHAIRRFGRVHVDACRNLTGQDSP